MSANGHHSALPAGCVIATLLLLCGPSQAFVSRGTTGVRESFSALRSLTVDRADVFLPGSTHPPSYLPGSPHQSTATYYNRFTDKLTSYPVPRSLDVDHSSAFRPARPYESSSSYYQTRHQPLGSYQIPKSLDLDRPEAFVPARPSAYQASRSVYQPRGYAPTSLEADKYRSFQGGDVFGRGTPHYSTSINTRRSIDSSYPATLPVDRPSAFVSGAPKYPTSWNGSTRQSVNYPSSLDADRSRTYESGSRRYATTSFQADRRPGSYGPTCDANARATRSRPSQGSYPTSFGVDRPDVFRPASPHEGTRHMNRSSNWQRGYVPTSLEADRFRTFESGDVFGRGTPQHSTYGRTRNTGYVPSSLSVDRPEAFRSMSTRPANGRPSRTSQQLGYDIYLNSSLSADRPKAFNPGPDWRK